MHAARMHIRAPSPFRGWAGAVQTEGQTCLSSGCAVDPQGPCSLGKGREMFQPLYEVAPCVCKPCSRCGDVHKRSRRITGHIYGYLWRSRGIVSLRSGRRRVWGFGGGIGSHLRGGSRSLMLKGYYVLSHLFERYLFRYVIGMFRLQCGVCAGRRQAGRGTRATDRGRQCEREVRG